MPRRLPWLKSESTAAAKLPRQKPARQLHLDSDDNGPRARRPTPRLGPVARAGRTPSTSPPPTPPSHDLMQDGLDGDDIYIMVEDEFHAVAKMFTQHLHHAEYVRLKNLAKSRTASTMSTISRPIDSITAMRNETKRKKEADIRDVRTNAAVQKIKSGANRPASDESGLSDADADNVNWTGTALQDLMTVSPTKNQISLTGLHGVKSSTRAAAGYSKAENKPSQPMVKAIDLGPKSIKPTLSKPTLTEKSTLDESTTDDLDAPAAKSQHRASKPSRISAPGAPKLQPQKSPRSRLKQSRNPHAYPTPDSDFNSGSESAESSHDRTRHVRVKQSEAARRRLKVRTARREAEREKRTGAGQGDDDRGTANVNDIPTFLV